MVFINNVISYLWRYILGIVTAVIFYGILALIFKLALITVQGPTLFSRLSQIAIFYIMLSGSYYFLFRQYGRKQSSDNLKVFFIIESLIVCLHLLSAVNASYSALWLLCTGISDLPSLLYNGAGIVKSHTEIPRAYYLLALLIEDICFAVFSLWGYYNGLHENK